MRNLQTGKEFRESIGQLPPPPPPNYATTEDEPPPPRGITLNFTRDNRTLVFSTFPAKAEVDQAKKDKKKPADGPKNGLRIMDLASGNVVHAERVKSFQVPSKGDGFLAYLREPEPAAAAMDADPKSDKSAKKKEYGSDLVIRNLATGDERTVHDVLEFALAKDGGTLVYAVGAKAEDSNGVYTLTPADLLLPGRSSAARASTPSLPGMRIRTRSASTEVRKPNFICGSATLPRQLRSSPPQRRDFPLDRS